ncbi:hypothetical protein QUF76_16775, partial [Desulfobacterales bacterium HSG16]|nr:hypothetical protein [Desulfobacterales bacterium HSG16]
MIIINILLNFFDILLKFGPYRTDPCIELLIMYREACDPFIHIPLTVTSGTKFGTGLGTYSAWLIAKTQGGST